MPFIVFASCFLSADFDIGFFPDILPFIPHPQVLHIFTFPFYGSLTWAYLAFLSALKSAPVILFVGEAAPAIFFCFGDSFLAIT